MDSLFQKRVVPAATLTHVDDGVPLAEALLAGGLDVLEITFRTPAAAGAIAAIAKALPEMLIGAGTLLTADQMAAALEAGIRFGVAPGLNESLVEQAAAAGVTLLPGVATPTDVDRALRIGCSLLKFFPAEALGGVPMLNAMAGPYAHTGVQFVPTGGISPANARSYLDLPIVAAVGGSWMVKQSLVDAHQWDAIEALAREAVAVCAIA